MIVHGFAGSMNEIKYLAEYLLARGLDVHTVLLAGHGGTKKELKKSSCQDWINSVGSAVTALRQEYRRIFLIGFSMGGLINAHFAPLPEVGKVVFINTPIYFWNLKIIATDIISGIHRRSFDKIAYYKKSVLGASIKSGVDFLKILLMSKKKIASVKKPALVVQCVNDESVYYRSAEYIKNKIGSCADLKYYQGGCHQVFVKSVELRDFICGDIYKFLISD